MKNLRTKMKKITPGQRTALQEALREMLEQGIKLTRDRLREWAGVDTAAASAALAGYREGIFDLGAREERTSEPPAPAEDGRVWALLPKGVSLEMARLTYNAGRELACLMDEASESYEHLPLDLEEWLGFDVASIAVASVVSAMWNPRRQLAVLRFATQMMLADGEDVSLELAELGLPLEDSDAGCLALNSLELDVAEWDAACRGEPIERPAAAG